jgi:hypothetical protein
MKYRISLLLFGSLVTLLPVIGHAQRASKPVTKSVATQGVRGTATVNQLTPEHVELIFKTKTGETRDTLRAKGTIPLVVNGRKANFFVGRFGSSSLPMLIVSLRDPDRIQDSRTIVYQLSSSGAMIGQRVLVDETLDHKYSDNTSGGRHYLSAIDTKLGTIYSLSYQRASFVGFYHTYEKLRVRQWEPSIDAFIETDQGFLRDRTGKLIESGRFNVMSEAQRQKIFVSNVLPPAPSETKKPQQSPPATPVKQASLR